MTSTQNTKPQTKLSEADRLELERLRAENARLKAASRKSVGTLKVTEKGGLSAYGLGRFPATYFAGQWLALAEAMPAILDALVENAASLQWEKDAPIGEGAADGIDRVKAAITALAAALG